MRALPGVEVTGWLPPEEVWSILRQRARAVAAPSRWFETGPPTVYEALAAGLPVVASDRSGAAEKVRHGETGFVVPPEETALAAAFAALRDGERAGAMGRAAKAAFAREPRDLATHARHLLGLYAGLAVTSHAATHHREASGAPSADPARPESASIRDGS